MEHHNSPNGPQPPAISPDLPKGLNQYDHLDASVTKGGAHRIYGVDTDGKKHALPQDYVLEAYGHDSRAVEDAKTAKANPDTSKDIYEEYKEAVSADHEGAKDLNFREWVKKGEVKRAAKWYSETRAHGEAPDEIDPDTGPTDSDIDSLMAKDHQEQLNAREGKSNPTKDDVEYYRWLKKESGHPEEDKTTEDPTQELDPLELARQREEAIRLETRRATEDQEGQELSEKAAYALERYATLQGKLDKNLVVSNPKIKDADTGNKVSLEEARDEYEDSRRKLDIKIVKRLQDAGYDNNTISREMLAQAMGRPGIPPVHPQSRPGEGDAGLVRDLTLRATQEAARIDRQSRFLRWWMNQSGKLGLLKKAAVVIPTVGVAGTVLGPVGIGAGLALAPGSAVAGGAFGALKAKSNAVKDSSRLAEQRVNERHKAQLNRIGHEADEYTSNVNANPGVVHEPFRSDDVTIEHLEGARAVRKQNFKNARKPVAVGVVAGAVTGPLINQAASSIHSGLESLSDLGQDNNTAHHNPGNMTVIGEVPYEATYDQIPDTQSNLDVSSVSGGDGLTDIPVDGTSVASAEAGVANQPALASSDQASSSFDMQGDYNQGSTLANLTNRGSGNLDLSAGSSDSALAQAAAEQHRLVEQFNAGLELEDEETLT